MSKPNTDEPFESRTFTNWREFAHAICEATGTDAEQIFGTMKWKVHNGHIVHIEIVADIIGNVRPTL